MGKSKELATLTDAGGTIDGALNINGNNSKISASNNHLILHDTAETDTGSNWWYIYRNNGKAGALSFYRGVDRMTIDASGRVTMPYQPAFFVSHQTINAGGIVNYQTVVTNIGNYWSTANSRFTAPVSGTYTFSAGALHDVDNSYIMFYKNGGVSHTQYGYLDMVEDQASITCVLTLSAGDYMQVWQNLDTEGNGHSWFCGHLIG